MPALDEGGAVGRVDWLDGQLSTKMNWTGSSGSIPQRLTEIEAAVAKLPQAGQAPGVPERLLALEMRIVGSGGSPMAANRPIERAAWLDGQLGITSEGRMAERLDDIEAVMDEWGY